MTPRKWSKTPHLYSCLKPNDDADKFINNIQSRHWTNADKPPSSLRSWNRRIKLHHRSGSQKLPLFVLQHHHQAISQPIEQTQHQPNETRNTESELGQNITTPTDPTIPPQQTTNEHIMPRTGLRQPKSPCSRPSPTLQPCISNATFFKTSTQNTTANFSITLQPARKARSTKMRIDIRANTAPEK